MLSIIPQTAYFGRVAKDLGTILFFDIDPYYLFVHLYVDMLTKKLRYTRVKVYANAQVPTNYPFSRAAIHRFTRGGTTIYR